jgi:hypothetical protein
MLKVLIVEDEKRWHDDWRRKLDGKVVLVSTFSIQEAEEQFVANPDIVAIVMDACVPGDEPTTEPLVQKFRATFTGPMIAASGAWDYRKDLMRAGCDHESPKYELPQKLLAVLGL